MHDSDHVVSPRSVEEHFARLAVHGARRIIVVRFCDRMGGCVPYQTEDVGVRYKLEIPSRHRSRDGSVGSVGFCASLASIVAVPAAVSIVNARVHGHTVRLVSVRLGRQRTYMWKWMLSTSLRRRRCEACCMELLRDGGERMRWHRVF